MPYVKDAESMYGIFEREREREREREKKIIKGVQRCLFKNSLTLLSTEVNEDLICTTYND